MYMEKTEDKAHIQLFLRQIQCFHKWPVSLSPEWSETMFIDFLASIGDKRLWSDMNSRLYGNRPKNLIIGRPPTELILCTWVLKMILISICYLCLMSLLAKGLYEFFRSNHAESFQLNMSQLLRHD